MHGTYSRNEKRTALGYGCCCCYCSLQSRVTRSGRFPPPIGNLGRALTHQSGGAPTSQVGSALPHQLKWPIALQIVAGRAVSLVGEPPTETYRPDEWSGANRGRAHRANLCRPALEVRRLRTAPDGWNCCCNCCCHGEMRCGVDTSAGQPCATAPRE